MPKVQTKTQDTNGERPTALDVIMDIALLAIQFRYPTKKPSLADLARVCSASARVLRISDLDERLEVENRATINLAKKLNLISS